MSPLFAINPFCSVSDLPYTFQSNRVSTDTSKGSDRKNKELSLMRVFTSPLFETDDWTKMKAMEIIRPVNDLVEEYGQNIKKLWPKEFWVGVTDSKGEIWGTVRKTASAPYPTYVRQDWLDKYGLIAPKTIEEWFYKYHLAVRR